MSTTRIQIGRDDHGRTMALEEFREAEEEPGFLYELARGMLEVTEVPGDDHWQIVHNLHEMFSAYSRLHPGAIRRIGHGSDVRLIIPVLESDRHPDLGVALRDDPRDDRKRLRPSLVAEVVSPGKKARQRDYEEKLEEYLAFGLDEYWVVDPERRIVTLFCRRGQAAAASWSKQVFEGDEVIVSERLPGFEGTVAGLWVDAGLDADSP